MRALLFFLLLPLSIALGTAQTIEFNGGIGVTLVDVEGLVESTEVQGTTAEDWGLFSTGFGAQGFFMDKGNLSFGAEIMWQHLFWYGVNVNYVPRFYREYTVNSFKITPIMRYNVSDSFVLDVGPEFNFMDGLAIGLLGSANYYISINDKIAIPIKGRLDIIFGEAVYIPLTVQTGVRINL